MTEYNKLVNGEVIPMTPEEISFRQAEEAAHIEKLVRNHILQFRYQREVGGVPYLGKTIQTDRETRANWIGILINAQSDPNYTVTWKTMDGSFAVYNAAEAVDAALTVSGHVQKCFDAESAISGQTFESIEAVEAAFNEAYGE